MQFVSMHVLHIHNSRQINWMLWLLLYVKKERHSAFREYFHVEFTCIMKIITNIPNRFVLLILFVSFFSFFFLVSIAHWAYHTVRWYSVLWLLLFSVIFCSHFSHVTFNSSLCIAITESHCFYVLFLSLMALPPSLALSFSPFHLMRGTTRFEFAQARYS